MIKFSISLSSVSHHVKPEFCEGRDGVWCRVLKREISCFFILSLSWNAVDDFPVFHKGAVHGMHQFLEPSSLDAGTPINDMH